MDSSAYDFFAPLDAVLPVLLALAAVVLLAPVAVVLLATMKQYQIMD